MTTMLDVNQAFNTAFNLHVAGRAAEAEPIYRQILALNPKHVDSLHLLGVVHLDQGRHAEALDLIGKAIGMNDRVADYHCNMGLGLFKPVTSQQLPSITALKRNADEDSFVEGGANIITVDAQDNVYVFHRTP